MTKRSNKIKLSIIIPVYNEEQTVLELFKKVYDVKLKNVEKEIIIVDDGSTDNSTKLIQEVKKRNGEVKVFLSVINLGKGAAIRFGLKKATGDIILLQDADLELEPNEYYKLLAPILSGKTQVVYGSRFLKKSNKISSKTIFANKFLTNLENILIGSNLTDMETAYKVFTSDVIRRIRLRCVGFDFEPEVTSKIIQLGFKIIEIPISYTPRRADEGKKISMLDGIEAISQILKNWLFPRPTSSPEWSLIQKKINTLTFPLRIFSRQDWLKKWSLPTLEDERIHYVMPYLLGKLLDIGCGENNLVKKWGNGIGIDVYPWKGVDRVCDTTNLPFKDQQFDSVSFVASLNHIPDRISVLGEASRVLKPGGRLIITMIDERIGWLCHKLVWWDKDQYERGMTHGEKFGLNDNYLNKIIKEKGFEIIIKKKFSFFGLNNIYVAIKR